MDTGQKLATFRRGPDTELRVTLDQFNGVRFVSARLWNKGEDGYRPSTKGCTFRLHELAELVRALNGLWARTATANEFIDDNVSNRPKLGAVKAGRVVSRE